MINHDFLCLICILSAVRAQVRIGDLFFPITVQPPSYDIQNNDRTDTLYDEVIDIQPDDELKIPDSKQEKLYLKTSIPKPDKHMAFSYLKPSDASYKTDQIPMKESELAKVLFPPKAIQFKEDSGVVLTSAMPSNIPSFGSQPIITMSHAIVMNNEMPEVDTKTLPPLALLSSTNDVIDRVENMIKQENTSVTQNMGLIIPKLESDVQRLDLEVTVLKDLVQKLLRHVYREKSKVNKKKQISRSSMSKENLRAVQILDSSSTLPFLHTWKSSAIF